MKKYFLLTFLSVLYQLTLAQKLYFSKANYTDSLSLEKSMPILARQVLAIYPFKPGNKPNDDLARLQVVAGEYSSVPNSVKQFGIAVYGDSISTKDIDFNYKIYALVMSQKPVDSEQFKAQYFRIFDFLYNDMPKSSKTFVEQSSALKLRPVKDKLATTIKKYSRSDSLTIPDAIDLCRNYAAYKVGNALSILANEMSAKLEKDKYIISDSVLVKMPDGGTVSLGIVRDRHATTPQPVVLKYNIYAENNNLPDKKAVEKGYTGITAYTRGKRLSHDVIEPYEHDAKDAYYIIDWISKQPWCNGKIGMYGGSYVGFSQWAAVKYMHPALKTIVPQASVGAGIDFPDTHNIFMTYMLSWVHYVTDGKLIDREDHADKKKWNKPLETWYTSGKSFRSLDSIEGRPNAIFQRWLNHPGYDDYWQSMTPQKEEFAKINIPIFTTTGYYDDDQLGAMYYYRQYHKWNKNPNYYLLIGPYTHAGSQAYPERAIGGYTLDSVANIEISDLVFDWFDYILKGKPRPAILKDKVNFEVMGKNEWLHVPSLDRMSNDTLRFYLGTHVTGGQYPLMAVKPAKPGYVLYNAKLNEREKPVFSANDEEPVLDTTLHDVKGRLIFISEPVDKPLVISGSFKASLVASLNKRDMDIAIDLYEKNPDGKYFFMKQGIQRASYARDKNKRQLLVPGKATMIKMDDNFITSRQLQKGSRIVIVLGINKGTDWQINYGTGKDVSDETIKDAAVPMLIKWYNNSVIKLPILR